MKGWHPEGIWTSLKPGNQAKFNIQLSCRAFQKSSTGACALSEMIAHSTVYLHLSDCWAVITQLDCWLRWWYTVEWAVSSESVMSHVIHWIQITSPHHLNMSQEKVMTIWNGCWSSWYYTNVHSQYWYFIWELRYHSITAAMDFPLRDKITDGYPIIKKLIRMDHYF